MTPHKALTALDVAFPASVKDLMPKYEEIPEEFRHFNAHNKWQRIFNDFFFHGAKNIRWSAKQGIDESAAVRHIRSIMGSYEPQHEHKEAACAYLMSLWFDDITYQKPEGAA